MYVRTYVRPSLYQGGFKILVAVEYFRKKALS